MNKKFTKLIAALALLVFMAPNMVGWGQSVDSYTANSADKPSAVNGTTTGTVTGTNSISWSYSVTQNTASGKTPFVQYSSDYGWQLGSANSPCTAFSISTSGISGTITKIETVTGSKSSSSKINVTVGGEAFGTQNQSTGNGSTVSTQIFEGLASGAIVVTSTASTAAFYFKSVTVTYTTGYTVTFNCDGGEGCPSDMTVQSGENNFTVPSTVPTKDCYTFDNVYLDENLEEYEPGETYTITSDLELTASWTHIYYDVTYYANNGSEESFTDGNQSCGSTYEVIVTAEDLEFEGSTGTPYFVNWNTQADGNGTAYEVGDEITISADVDLYAQWSATARYTVTYDCNGGTGCPENQMVFDGTQIQLPAAPSKEGYIFVGWMCDADLETYVAGADYTVASNVEFEAQWLEKLAIPTITVAGVSNGTANTYFVTAQVTINQTDVANIYYTTDGTNPTANSTEYENPFNVTSNCTIKAIAIFEGYANSDIAEQEIIIVQPNEATFTNGVYTEPFTSQESFGKWYAYSVSGDETWVYNSSYGAYITGSSHNNEDWLISPKMAVENGKLHIAFDCVGRYGNQQTISALYSTDYPGYGNPNSYNWTAVTTKPAIPYAASSWTYKTIECDVNAATDVYFAFKYVSTTSSSGTFEMKPFTAKQYYPVNYFVNGGSGTMDSEYYVVGETVYVPYPYFHTEDIDDGFIAPEGMAFSTWNTQANGQGTTYNPGEGDSFVMGTSAVNLYAQWATAYQVTVGNPANVDILASIGSQSIVNGESANAVAGMRIELIVQEVAQGFEFGQFIVTDEDEENVEVTYDDDNDIYYFIMPAEIITVTATATRITTVTDELTYSLIGVEGTSYVDWSGKKSNSTAVYAGQSAGGDNNNSGNCIQLRSKNSNSGIVTTTSGGKVKKIIVTWNNQTSNNNRLDVYGKNTPYEKPTDLYGTSGNSNQGTSLGSITKGTSTELIVEGDYTYLGLRSYSGALYIDKIEITWDNTYSATTSVAAHTEDAGWCFIASPFSANNSLVATDEDYLPVAMDDDATDLYYYDEPTHMWMNYKQHPNDFTFANGVGYLYANSQDVTLTFAGTSLVSGDTKEITLSYTEAAAPLAGWNLVGNPFDCNAILDKPCYTISGMAINTEAQTANEYLVGPCKGVLVKATENGETVTFTKVAAGQTPQPNQLQMIVAQQVVTRNGASTGSATVEDNAIVSFNEGNRLEKFAFNADAAKLYIPQNDKEYAIVSAEAQGEMPVNFRATKNGTYTLTINPEGVEMNYLHLIDNMTGANIDLLSTPAYTFNAKTTDYESRFRLVFSANNATTDTASEETFAFFSNGSLIVNNEGEATLQVIDVMGRVLSNQTVNGTTELSLNQVPGVYVLRLVSGDNVRTQKVIVK